MWELEELFVRERQQERKGEKERKKEGIERASSTQHLVASKKGKFVCGSASRTHTGSTWMTKMNTDTHTHAHKSKNTHCL